MVGGAEFDDVGDEEVAGDEGVEESAEEDVIPTVVVAADADEDSVLDNVKVGNFRCR